MKGGERKGAGAPTGSRTDNVKMCIKISRKNAERLRAQKGKAISRQIDMAVDAWFDRESLT